MEYKITLLVDVLCLFLIFLIDEQSHILVFLLLCFMLCLPWLFLIIIQVNYFFIMNFILDYFDLWTDLKEI